MIRIQTGKSHCQLAPNRVLMPLVSATDLHRLFDNVYFSIIEQGDADD